MLDLYEGIKHTRFTLKKMARHLDALITEMTFAEHSKAQELAAEMWEKINN